MPPTDCFDDSDSGSSSSLSCVPEQHLALLPTTRSPLHHGTDPDLSAPTPLPSGVAATGLDLSPADAGSICGMTTASIAKRKQRGSPGGGGGGGGHLSTMPAARLSRSFSSGARAESQAKRVATLIPPARDDDDDTQQQHAPTATRLQSRRAPATRSTAWCRGRSSTPGGSSATATAAAALRSQQTPAESEALALLPRAMVVPSGDEGGSPGGAGGAPLAQPGVRAPHREAAAAAAAGVTPTAAAAAAALGMPGCSAIASTAGVHAGADDGGDSAGSAERREKQMALKAMMLKAKMASDNIRLLLHAKRCEGICCKEPGCESARQLVQHIRGCRSVGGKGCHAKCVQAQKMLKHYAECNRKRALGGRYCLVCSLVARSATNGNNSNNHHANSNTASAGTGHPSAQHRQPLGRLVSGYAAPRHGPGVCGMQKHATRGAAGLPSPVAITRLRRGTSGEGEAATQGQPKDGVFYRPFPKTRRGSWGGYDRCRHLRRTRFDSIPEELVEDDGVEDELDQETTSKGEGGTKSTDEVNRSKTLLSSHSL